MKSSNQVLPLAGAETQGITAGLEFGKCRVRELIRGTGGGWCEVRPKPDCPFGLAYGSGLLCQHPHCEEIVRRTRAGLEA